MSEGEKVYLIKKHGLYYRPDSRGYTGVKDKAGRYTKEHAERIGLEYVHQDDAPSFSPKCYDDIMEAHIADKDAAIRDLAKQLKFIRDNSDETLANNVAFKTLQKHAKIIEEIENE